MEFPKNPEKKEGLNFEQAVERGVEAALSSVRERFELAKNEQDRLAFHNTRHTGEVVRRTAAILEAAGADARTIGVGRLAAAFHDTVQRWEENRVPWEGNRPGDEHTKVLRKRFIAENERASAGELLQYMDAANRDAGAELFSETDRVAIGSAIDATIPGFDPEKKTVIQPNLKKESPLIARAVALADLGTAGMDGPEVFCSEGDALFREENLDIMDALKNPAAIGAGEKEYFRKRMIGWSKFQPLFANGRKELLERELEGIPEAGRERVRVIFSKFDETIEAAQERARARESMTFEELARDMGYGD